MAEDNTKKTESISWGEHVSPSIRVRVGLLRWFGCYVSVRTVQRCLVATGYRLKYPNRCPRQIPDHHPLLWRHNEPDNVSNHQPHDRLLNRLFRRRSKKTSKPRLSGLCAGNSPETGEFPAQMASNAENVSIWWRHHDCHWKLAYRHQTGTTPTGIMWYSETCL